MFLIPALYFIIKKDTVIQVNVDRITTEFVETVSANGYVTSEIYEKYLEGLAGTGKLYDIELIHEQTAYEPEYILRSASEVIDDDEDIWTGTNDYYSSEVVTEIPVISDPVNNGGLNTDTNETVLAGAVNDPASSTHVHSDECYHGVKHVHNDSCSRTYHSPEWYTVANDSGSAYHNGCGGTIYYSSIVSQCSGCGVTHQYSQTWCSGNCGTFEYTSGYSGTCTCTGYYEYSCEKKEGSYYDGNTEVYPICHQLVLGLTPTHLIQKVYTNEPLITTAVVTYRDGSTKTVICTTPFSTASITQNQKVTLTYSYTIDGTEYHIDCTINVTVIPRIRLCLNGHTYNLKEDGSDPGCPYCKNWLRSLAVLVPASGSLTMYRNPSGSLITEGVGLIAVYLDGHSEYVYNGYIDNLDPDYVGTQTVTIGYKGLTTSLNVTVVRNRKKCSVCGLYYDLYMDDTDPGCPYCKAKVPVFTGYIKKYTAATYEDEIIKELFDGSGIYYFRRGDVFIVEAKSRKAAPEISVIGKLFHLKVYVRSSDTIKNEEVHY